MEEISTSKKRNYKTPSGPWIETRTGKKFPLLDPEPHHFDIADIAAHLSKTCRYVGACPNFYSVAEHCIIGAKLIPEPYKLAFLLHDAHEAYIGDISRPLKVVISGLWPDQDNTIIKKLQYRLDAGIYNKFYPHLLDLGCDKIQDYHKVIKDFDNAMLRVEAEVFGFDVGSWSLPHTKATIESLQFKHVLLHCGFGNQVINPCKHIENSYLEYFKELGGKND